MENLNHILYSGNSSTYQRRLAIEEFEKLMDDYRNLRLAVGEFEKLMDDYRNLKCENEFLNDQLKSEKNELDSLSIADLQALKEMLDDRYQRTNLNEYKFKMEKVEDRIIEITDKFFKI